ncbi:MAG: hypothetical protein LC808_17055, partial [Actinobacteria bacterium]|nr:hypothetical protein [Actinomycetota bacterium]
LAQDHLDHHGKSIPATREEAEVALALEDAGVLKGPIRRPMPNEGHSGDFVDGDDQNWDVKAPRSRDVLEEEIRRRALEAGHEEPEFPPVIQGEFELDAELKAIHAELNSHENVIVDTSHLNQSDEQLLRSAVNSDPTIRQSRFRVEWSL